MPPTHTVSNQVPPLVDFDVSAPDPALQAALSAAGVPLNPRLWEPAVDAGSAEIWTPPGWVWLDGVLVGRRPAGAKSGLLAGMSMTEKQGRSDLRGALSRYPSPIPRRAAPNTG